MSGKMLAAVVHAKGDLRLEQVPVPDITPDMIRVKVRACSVCGTDLRIYRTGDPRAAYPVILGHEIAGIVDAVGRDVKGHTEAERVCVAPGHGCGQCRMCRNGHPNVCVAPFPSLGYKVNGGFAEYIAVPANIVRLGFVNRIPEVLSFDQASISEILACCLNAQDNTPVGAGDRVLVIGAGPAGMLHGILAKAKGAEKVIVTQRSGDRLSILKERTNVDRIVASSEECLETAVMEETDGEGADAVFVCAPSREAQEAAIRLAAPRGRVNFFGGLPKDDHITGVDANLVHYKELSIGGASSSLPEGNREALRLLAEGVVDPDLVITHRFPLAEIADAFEMVESRRAIKVVVNPGH